MRNPGLAETAVYRGVAATGFSLEEYDRSLVTQEVALDTEAHESSLRAPLTSSSTGSRFQRGRRCAADAATGQDWFAIVTGQLGLPADRRCAAPGLVVRAGARVGTDDPSRSSYRAPRSPCATSATIRSCSCGCASAPKVKRRSRSTGERRRGCTSAICVTTRADLRAASPVAHPCDTFRAPPSGSVQR